MTKNNNKFKIIILFVLLFGLMFEPNFLLASAINDQYDPEIQKLKDEIKQYTDRLSVLQQQQQAYENSIKAKKQEISNLRDQIDSLDNNMQKLDLEMQSTSLEMQKNNLEIANTKLEIDKKQAEIKNQKDKIVEVLININNLNRKKSYLEVLILKGNIGDFFKDLSELNRLQANLTVDLNNLNQLVVDLNNQKQDLENRQNQLNQLKDKLDQTNDKLTNDRTAKDQLLKKTKGQESLFQQMLSQVKAEQNQINSDIQNLDIVARKKLQQQNGTLAIDSGFIWPVASRKISAYFHDPDYPYRYIMEHPGIDIGGVGRGSPIRAALSGYVAKVKYDGSTNYAYIMIVAANGLSTVYGHISKPYVKEDDYVIQGEVIAASGGAPHSIGSGPLTTGSHLHFEVRLNGIPVDPLKYLP